ncbi:MAG: MBL fold metallo-hydrolase [Frankiaceae bacterium]|jgi:ribonuclease BN (tRNA processing enzyme)
MLLTVLGCAGTFPGPDSPCASYLVEHDGFRLLLDLGSGAVGALSRHHPTGDLLAVDAVVISHLHGDHWLDLIPYAYARRYAPGGAAPQLAVRSPPGLSDRLSRLGSPTVRGAYDLETITPGAVEIGPFQVTFGRAAHPVETYATRLTAGGRTLTYSADTGPCDQLVTLAGDADLLLCEASNTDGEEHPPKVHLTGRQAGEHAARACAGRLVLTHIVPYRDPAAAQRAAGSAYSGPVEVARSGATYDI